RTVRLWDLGKGKELRAYRGHDNYTLGVAFHPEGDQLVSAGDSTLNIWDVNHPQDHRVLAKISLLPLLREESSLAFHPDGRRLAFAHSGFAWDVDENKKLFPLLSGEEATERATTAAFSADGHILVIGLQRTFLRILDGENGKLLGKIPIDHGPHGLAF